MRIRFYRGPYCCDYHNPPSSWVARFEPRVSFRAGYGYSRFRLVAAIKAIWNRYNGLTRFWG